MQKVCSELCWEWEDGEHSLASLLLGPFLTFLWLSSSHVSVIHIESILTAVCHCPPCLYLGCSLDAFPWVPLFLIMTPARFQFVTTYLSFAPSIIVLKALYSPAESSSLPGSRVPGTYTLLLWVISWLLTVWEQSGSRPVAASSFWDGC